MESIARTIHVERPATVPCNHEILIAPARPYKRRDWVPKVPERQTLSTGIYVHTYVAQRHVVNKFHPAIIGFDGHNVIHDAGAGSGRVATAADSEHSCVWKL